jgi:hypothetical protein
MWLLALMALVAACCAKVTVGTFYYPNEQWVLIDTFQAGNNNTSLTIENVEMVRVRVSACVCMCGCACLCVSVCVCVCMLLMIQTLAY